MTSLRQWRNFGLLLLALLCAWQLVHALAGDTAIASPAQTLAFGRKLLGTAAFWDSASESLRTFAAALFFAVTIGLALGFLLGFHKFSGEVLTPLLMGLASIPKVTLYPIVLLMFGLGIGAKITFGALHGILPIALFTIGAVTNIRPVFVKLGRASRLGPLELVRRILLPAALPEIFTGLRIGFSLTLIGTILAEMFASQKGLGFLLMQAIGLHNVPLITTLAVLLTTFACVFSVALLIVDRRIRARL